MSFLSSYLSKRADMLTELQPQQERVRDRMMNQPGLVVAHGLGTGKTLSSLAVADEFDEPTDVVVPASLMGNYRKEIKKHLGDAPGLSVQSMQGIAGKGTTLRAPLLIIDEAHRARNAAGLTRQILGRSAASKRLLLTATPFYNNPADIAPLVNMAAGETILPENPREFEKRYVSTEPVSPGFFASLMGVEPGERRVLNPDTKGELRDKLRKWVDYYQTKGEHFPSVKRDTVHIPMTGTQKGIYDSLMGEAPFWVRWKVARGLPPGKGELDKLNSFLGGARQISNTTRGFSPEDWKQNSPKIQRAVNDTVELLKKNPAARVVAYSNYINGGVEPYKDMLRDAGVPFGEVTGSMTGLKRDRIVEDYNTGKTPVLLISSAGAEGLDLKGTRMVQILDPHWNNQKLAQVEGRAARYKSHEHLPENDRNVLIRRYVATRPGGGVLEWLGLEGKPKAIDEYMYQVAGEKEQLNNQARDLLSGRAG